MYKHLPKLVWTPIVLFGLYLLITSFYMKKTEVKCNVEGLSNACPTSIQTGVGVKSLTHHMLDLMR